jgi:hypothetical protein
MATRDRETWEIFKSNPEQAYRLYQAAIAVAEELAQTISKDAARVAGRAEYRRATETVADAIGAALRAPQTGYARVDPGPLLEGATKLRKEREANDARTPAERQDVAIEKLRKARS